MVEAAHNGQGQEGKPQISAHALTGEGTKTRNKSQETSTDTLGFYIYTHTQANTLGFYTYTRIHKQWEGKETVAEAAHNGLGQEDKPQISD